MSTVLIIRTARRKPVLPASSAGFVPAILSVNRKKLINKLRTE
jgi:hypothetical protein